MVYAPLIWGTSGEVRGLSRGSGEPDSLPANRQVCLQQTWMRKTICPKYYSKSNKIFGGNCFSATPQQSKICVKLRFSHHFGVKFCAIFLFVSSNPGKRRTRKHITPKFHAKLHDTFGREKRRKNSLCTSAGPVQGSCSELISLCFPWQWYVSGFSCRPCQGGDFVSTAGWESSSGGQQCFPKDAHSVVTVVCY